MLLDNWTPLRFNRLMLTKPNDRIVPNIPDTTGQLIPTSPHVIDENAPTSSPSSNDPNIVLAGEKPENFVRLYSDDENCVNSVYDDDDDLGAAEPAAEDGGTAPDLHFQPSLLGAVGSVAEIARGNVSKNVLSDIKFNGWSEPSNVTPHPYMHEPYEARPADWIKRDYPNIYNGVSGPTPEALQAAETACGSFFLFALAFMWDDIVQQSNHSFEENLGA
ncbi:unnamed protein product [Phytophthora fragariaefolia]|uniref:Unnamed protein product n=1 Tax=Phytophthora fragariaefolia TaxID=1490495 RepID=A0A9W6TUI9_9STRA|nr:unnamed protein product [Phytophthora fragariaefolia]